MNPTENNLQIQAPELLTGTERTRDKLITALMWGVYLYLWVPLISLGAWLLGFEFAYDVMIRTGGARNLGHVLAFYAVVLVLIFATVSIWSLGNRLRYGGMHRRHAGNSLSVAAMAKYFEIDVTTVDALRTMKSAAIEFDAEGRPVISDYPRRQSDASDAANTLISASESHA
jgi:biofilm PGA synthesis protein PgaD